MLENALPQSHGASPPLDERSRALRRLLVRALRSRSRGHIGSALSLFEILRVLYDDVLAFRADDPHWQDRDRCVLSKGHGCLALYAVLVDKGFFPAAELDRFCKKDGLLGGLASYGKIPGVEATAGSLGHGFSMAVGHALAGRIRKQSYRTFAILGDGEIQEGAIWEGAMNAAKHRLDRLTAIIDYNKIQSAGRTSEIQPIEPLADKWRAFGWHAQEVDGHDVEQLRHALQRVPFESGKPSVLICHTVKGKGFPFAEDDPTWHHRTKLSEKDFADMATALGGIAHA